MLLRKGGFGGLWKAMNFSSDTSAPVHPRILEAIVAANDGYAPSYGSDRWSALARERLEAAFECELDVWFTSSGTAANALGLSVLCPPTGAVACHAEAHIERDERGAVEFQTGGGRLSLLPGANGKIASDTLVRRLAANNPGFVHETPVKVLSISNLTECGTAYTADEITALARIAREGRLKVHLDGARFANAAAFTGASLAGLSWRAGVDVMSFGATKNGAAGCEVVLLFGEARDLLRDLQARAKRAGHMPPKLRYTAAQMAAYLEGGLWLELASHANAMARELAAALTAHEGVELAQPVEGNEVFARLPEPVVQRLKEAGAGFYPWLDGSFRFVCSWATNPAGIAALNRVISP